MYSDQRTQRNLEKLNEDLHDIQSIMTRNINDVLEQGERLDRVENMSRNLALESKKAREEGEGFEQAGVDSKVHAGDCFGRVVYMRVRVSEIFRRGVSKCVD